MRHTLFALGLAFVALAAGAGVLAQSDAVVGQWVGTWDGSGSGNFDLTVQKKDAGHAGRVAVTTDGGNYDAELKGVAVSGQGLKATYDFPLDPSAEVAITAKFEGEKATGTWTLRPKGGGAEVASGTFALKKK
ncbi:MAG TPA: hypothetical protein VKH42_03975 [Vicinamibacterales bacterium]|nr:hypothetical protein [Vicinamibacterales bacterium]